MLKTFSIITIFLIVILRNVFRLKDIFFNKKKYITNFKKHFKILLFTLFTSHAQLLVAYLMHKKYDYLVERFIGYLILKIYPFHLFLFHFDKYLLIVFFFFK